MEPWAQGCCPRDLAPERHLEGCLKRVAFTRRAVFALKCLVSVPGRARGKKEAPIMVFIQCYLEVLGNSTRQQQKRDKVTVAQMKMMT